MKYKLVWEMHGPDAHPTAEHHAVHLEEFAKKFKIELHQVGVEKIADNFSAAIMVINESDVETIQKSLRPHHVIEYTEE
ncbi:hypothetical protein [Reichenbachiella versicolor]|uniref:hypothetical protein n=1 Tax=Reichenbachiella versicolor TaxID=1821036 RepID=UPI000D6E959F|nr:hypothetical protein [Reichenbachiella versicolor]